MQVSEFDGEVRCVVLGEYMVETNATVRNAARAFGVSKSTVHKDVTQSLKNVNRGLYNEVQKVLLKNKSERHLRGGQATREKYRNLHEKGIKGVR